MIFCVFTLLVANVNETFATTAKNKPLKAVAAKTAKRSSTSVVVNTLLHGIGAPSASLGVNGDFYIDTITMNIYGPKSKKAWPVPKSLIGPQGVAGVAGKQGASGKDGRDGTNGKDGLNGKDGERGAVGASGSGSGIPGPAGATGPAGAVGPAGPAGAQGATGPAGATGAQGIQGIPGSVGPTGPVKVFLADLAFTGSLSGTAATTKNSSDFGTLAPGKKYFLTAYVYAVSELTSIPPLSANLSAVGADVTPVVRYSTTYGHTYRSSVDREESGVSVVATINGSALVGADYQLRLSITCGTNTSTAGASLTLTGFYLLQEVSEIN